MGKGRKAKTKIHAQNELYTKLESQEWDRRRIDSQNRTPNGAWQAHNTMARNEMKSIQELAHSFDHGHWKLPQNGKQTCIQSFQLIRK